MKAYKPQSFDHLTGLDGISDAQVKEHLELYQGYVKQVNALSDKLTELLAKGKPAGTDPYFAELTRHIDSFMHSGEAPWPVERTLLTTGLLDALLISHRDKGRRVETPYLDIAYQSKFDWNQPPPPPLNRPLGGQ